MYIWMEKNYAEYKGKQSWSRPQEDAQLKPQNSCNAEGKNHHPEKNVTRREGDNEKKKKKKKKKKKENISPKTVIFINSVWKNVVLRFLWVNFEQTSSSFCFSKLSLIFKFDWRYLQWGFELIYVPGSDAFYEQKLLWSTKQHRNAQTVKVYV